VENGKISLSAIRAFDKLFGMLNLPNGELGTMAENLRFALDTSAENRLGNQSPLVPQRVEQLVWLGVSPRTIAVLAPYITVLPTRTAVNLNTASAEVLCASIESLDMARARQLVTARALVHFQTLSDVTKLIGGEAGQVVDGQHGVASRFFEVRGRLRLEDLVVQERSLVQRDGQDVKTLWRERVAGSILTNTTNASLQ